MLLVLCWKKFRESVISINNIFLSFMFEKNLYVNKKKYFTGNLKYKNKQKGKIKKIFFL